MLGNKYQLHAGGANDGKETRLNRMKTFFQEVEAAAANAGASSGQPLNND
jgi:hypothetical protein